VERLYEANKAIHEKGGFNPGADDEDDDGEELEMIFETDEV
jgi:hypothetical protein